MPFDNPADLRHYAVHVAGLLSPLPYSGDKPHW